MKIDLATRDWITNANNNKRSRIVFLFERNLCLRGLTLYLPKTACALYRLKYTLFRVEDDRPAEQRFSQQREERVRALVCACTRHNGCCVVGMETGLRDRLTHRGHEYSLCSLFLPPLCLPISVFIFFWFSLFSIRRARSGARARIRGATSLISQYYIWYY